jgi:1,4-dihydroxy-2-naphthoyl-CoA hydrolase
MTAPTFQHQFMVALHDTDAAGVLFFAHLFRHVHDAYETWMATLGFPLDAMIRDGKLALPLVHAQADYRRPLRHGYQVTVDLNVTELGPSSFQLAYRLRTSDGDVAATARTVHVCISPGVGRPRPLPDALSQRLTEALSLTHPTGNDRCELPDLG